MEESLKQKRSGPGKSYLIAPKPRGGVLIIILFLCYSIILIFYLII